MTVEVIGKDQSVQKTCTCRKCGSILKYYPVDVKQGTSYDYTGDRDYYKYISCPSCGNQVHV